MKKIVIVLLAFVFISSAAFAQMATPEKKSVGKKAKAVVGKIVNITVAEPAKGINAGAITITDNVGKVTAYTVNSTAKILGTSLDVITLNKLKIGDKIKLTPTETNEAKSIKVIK